MSETAAAQYRIMLKLSAVIGHTGYPNGGANALGLPEACGECGQMSQVPKAMSTCAL
jgi:hypothetical protein